MLPSVAPKENVNSSADTRVSLDCAPSYRITTVEAPGVSEAC